MAKTIKDVAREAGVSISTVSRALNNSGYVSERTRKAIEQAMNGYTPNTAAVEMVTKRTQNIGLIISYNPNYFFSNPIYMQAMMGISNTCKQNNYRLLVDVNTQPYDFTTLFRNRSVDGLIFLGVDDDLSRLKELKQEHFPFVLLGSVLEPEFQIPQIDIDDVKIGYEATSLLLQMGHRRIAYLGGNVAFGSCAKRLQGYENAMKEAGLPCSSITLRDKVEPTSERGYEMAVRLLSTVKDRPTAIFSFNDTLALGIYQAAGKMGLAIPEDISVFSVDNSEISKYITPPLSTYSQCGEEKGRLACQTLIDIIRNPKEWDRYSADITWLEGTIILRDSVKRLL